MPVQTLRTEIEELNNEIEVLNERLAHKRAEVEALEEAIEDKRADIAEKESEIERIEDEETVMDELRQIVNGGEILGRDADDIRAIIDFIRNGTRPAPETEILHNLSHTRTVVVNTETGEETEITPEMESGYITIVGTSHQKLWEVEGYTPQIGELVRLEKLTKTANCFAVLVDHYDDDGNEMAIGILPTKTGAKPAELAEVGLPCVCHQDVWRNREDLERTYEVVGAVPGKYVVIKPHIPGEESEPVEEPVEEPEMYRIEEPEIPEESVQEVEEIENTISGIAATVEEARRLFIAAMPDTCTIINPIEDCGDYFKINYLNHRMNNDPFCEAKVNKQ